MSYEEELVHHFNHGHEIYLRNISIDCVVFGFHENELKVLLLNPSYANSWALPGGFVLLNEHMDAAANRILFHRTGVKEIYLHQFKVFSNPDRSNKKKYDHLLKANKQIASNSWMFDRFISVGYSALVDFTKVEPTTDNLSAACKWFAIEEIPTLILDHQEILQSALQNLRLTITNHPVGYNLLPKKFTMPELQKLYETILDKKLDRRNFQRKILATKILKKLNESKVGVAHKAPTYYQFDSKVYKKVLAAGMGFQF
jgi:8-oxo-dGTP diphosphatase